MSIKIESDKDAWVPFEVLEAGDTFMLDNPPYVYVRVEDNTNEKGRYVRLPDGFVGYAGNKVQCRKVDCILTVRKV